MILIGKIYHPPDSCQEDNLRLLRHIQENVDQFLRDHPEGLVLVSGDFNPTSTGITELTTKRVTGLTQIIKVLTRDTGTLDWCLTNRSKLMASPKQLPKLGKSDHYSVLIHPAQSPTASKITKKTIEKRDLRPSRLREFGARFTEIQLTIILKIPKTFGALFVLLRPQNVPNYQII